MKELRGIVEGLPPDPRTKPGPGLGMWTSGFNMAGRQLLQVAEARLDLLKGDAAGAEAHLRQVSVALACPLHTQAPHRPPFVFFYTPPPPFAGRLD